MNFGSPRRVENDHVKTSAAGIGIAWLGRLAIARGVPATRLADTSVADGASTVFTDAGSSLIDMFDQHGRRVCQLSIYRQFRPI